MEKNKMNKQIGQVAKTVRRLLEDEAILLDEINREILEDCYLALERIAIKRPIVEEDVIRGAVVDTSPSMSVNPTGTPF
jgi:Trm5-related predicted tRNA methylase